MLNAIVRACLRYPRLVVLTAVAFFIYGALFLTRAPYDVFPDFVPAQAEVQTEAPGLSAEQVEQLITRPVEQAINGAAGVETVRSKSQQGLSVVTVVFKSGIDPYRSRQIVSESLSEAADTLPLSARTPRVAPLTSSTMDLLKVGFTSERLSPADLRDWVQWRLRPRLMSVPGVARATVYGGVVRRFEVQVRPDDLQTRGLGLNEVVTAVQGSTAMIGGGFIDTAEQRILIEPRAQATTPAEISEVVVRQANGVVVHLSDVADVVEAAAPDVGDAVIMGKPGVLISLSSQYGANTLATTRAVEAALAEIRPSLGALGITLHENLHRPANFIETALRGITEDLLIGALLIAVVLFVFMGNARTVLISFVTIPLSLLLTLLVLDRLGLSINTMTVGGLAVALGVVVDDAVIDVENIMRRLRVAPASEARAQTVLRAVLEVRGPVIYATLVIVLVLAPVLLMEGLQGAFFVPLAAAFCLATLISLGVSMTLTPALSYLALRSARVPTEPKFLERLKDWHTRRLSATYTAPKILLSLCAVVTLVAVVGLSFFSHSLLPAFREGHYVLQIAARPGTSLATLRRYGEAISRDLLAIPGVASVEQQIGRAEGGEDTWGTEAAEFHVELRPHLSSGAQDEIQAKVHTVLDSYPGLQSEVLTFLGDRIGESLSGETAALAVNIYGADHATLDRVADEVAARMEKVPGATDVTRSTPPQTPSVRIDVDMAAAAANGLTPQEIGLAVQTAYQGNRAAQIFETERAVDIAVTLPIEQRDSPETVGELLLRGTGGTLVHLSDVARVYPSQARTSISHIGGRLVQTVTANPTPSEAARVTSAVKTELAKMALPKGVYLEYQGVSAAADAARWALLSLCGLAFAGIVALLLLAFKDGRAVALVLGSVPVALAGGVAAVALTGATLSLGSLVGFITLFGVAARNAILLIAHTDHLTQTEEQPWSTAVVTRATREKVTPILMTALVTALGLLPLAVQSGQAGREIQGPMALVILGGLITSTLMSLFVMPSLIWAFRQKRPSMLV
ncbi:efflux RND transporter permease subunit [Asticcacaulis sp. DXS10W]|uniref:Efflux RND transporter permease subunit n=1 Tax=Asticcacaulis currens TaxID=2984210 RepID=A0ABT5IDZ0_9CAUL|nr:efflux RND transporter permease subunit [Asticcacaulis currens]MDC7694364.1 efflux RND transporter permease subunit [Asticcacaulis currens]